jgi:hypothetical protein
MANEVEIGSSWTPPQNYFTGADGTYPVTLVRIGVTDRDSGEFIVDGTRTYEGQFGVKTVQDWTFALDDGQIIESSVGAPRVGADGVQRISERSRYYGYVTALAGGKALASGTRFDPQRHLVGRMALATIRRDEKGYPRIVTLGAMPTVPARPAPEAPAPVAAPLREQVEAQADMPF